MHKIVYRSRKTVIFVHTIEKIQYLIPRYISELWYISSILISGTYHIRHICCSPFSSDLCYIWLKTFMILWLLSLWPASMKRHNGRSGVAERMALGQAQLSCGPFSQQCHFWWGVTLQNTSELQSDTSTHATGSVCSAMMAQQKHILFCHVQLTCSYVGKKVLISGISCLMTTHLARSRLHECCLAHRMRHVWQACFS